MDTTDPLAAFVLARLTEDETAALKPWGLRWRLDVSEDQQYGKRFHLSDADQATPLILDFEDEGTAQYCEYFQPRRMLADIEAKRRRVALYLEAKAAIEDILKGFRAEETPANFHMHAAQRRKREQAAGRFIALETSVKLDAMTWAKHGGFRPEWKVED